MRLHTLKNRLQKTTTLNLNNLPLVRSVILLILWSLLPCMLGAQSVVINEFSASNVDGLQDNLGKHPDWIELYNTTNSTVNLTGYYLSDKIDNPTKWQIPAGVVIPANDHQLFICDGRDEMTFSGIHTNFKLTQMKQEYIVLSDPSGVPIDFIQMVNPTQQDHARGRIADGAPTWGVTTQPSPNQSNQNFKTEYTDAPIFSEVAGFYNGSITLTLLAGADAEIRYTLDGDEPTNFNSSLYTGPITISSTTVVKAKAFPTVDTHAPSFTIVNTYFINETHSLPVVSVSSDRVETLLNGNNFDRNYITHTEYFEDGTRIFDMLGHFRSHGNDSWNLDQRGIRFYVEDDYGYAHKIDHQLFPTSDRTDFDVFILKASASDNFPRAAIEWGRPSCHIRDAYVQELSDRNDLNLDERRYRRCVLYVNGEYWGVYEMRERIDSDYTKYYYDQGEQWVDMLEYWGGLDARYGSDDDWETLYDFIVSNDLSISSNYDYVTERLDVSSMIDYIILNTFVVNTDWLNWNTKWWRGRKGEGTGWRYCLWDMDNIFGLGQNFTGLPDVTWESDPCDVEGVFGDVDNPDIGHIEMLVALFENENFFQQYASRYADLAATTFSCENMLGLLDEMIAEIEPEMPRQIARWNGSLDDWYENLDSLRSQIQNKCVVVVDQVADCYEEEGLTGPYDLLVDVFPPASGKVQMNSAIGTTYPWTSSYFGGIDLNFTALPEINFAFSHWEVANNTFSPDETQIAINMSLETGDTIIANFLDLNCGIMTTISGPAESCVDAEFTLNAEEGFASYLWSDGSEGVDMLATGPGTYGLTVSDEDGCFGVASFVVEGFPTVDLQIIGSLSICDGEVTSLAATPGFDQYNWSNGGNMETIVVGTSGVYEVSITDDNNCVVTTSVIVEAEAEVVPEISGPMAICTGGMANLTLSNTYSAYEWSDNSTGTELPISGPGNYSVTVTNTVGCTGIDNFTVATGIDLQISGTGPSEVCSEGQPALLGLINSYTNYQWSTGSTQSTISINESGTYSVTVTDEAACTGTTNFTITDLEIAMTNETVNLCYGEMYNGVVYTENSQVDLNLSSYQGCDSVHRVNLLVAPALGISFETNGACSGQGYIATDVSGGTGGYNYMWNTGAMTADLPNVPSGTYSLTITDAAGCTQTASTVIDAGTPINFNSEIDNVSCVDAEDGMILLDITSGTPPYEVNWSNGATGVSLENLPVGDYVFEIVDANDCNLIGSITIENTGEIFTNVITTGTQTNTGTAIANVSGGQGPYTYQWSNGATGIFVNNLTRGDYTVTITDANGCTSETDFYIDYPTATELPAYFSLFRIFPNPSNGVFKVDLIFKNAIAVDIKIVDLSGKTIFLTQENGREILVDVDISSAPAGTYLLMVESDQGMAVKPLVLSGF